MKNMKKLDELIYTMRFQRTDSDTISDAVEQLRDYKDLLIFVHKLKNDFDELTRRYIDENPPLTWDELKQMEGKPVWVEWTGSPRWGIVDGIYKDAFGAENLVVCVPHDYLHFDKRMQGDVWQAYRKERHDEIPC